RSMRRRPMCVAVIDREIDTDRPGQECNDADKNGPPHVAGCRQSTANDRAGKGGAGRVGEEQEVDTHELALLLLLWAVDQERKQNGQCERQEQLEHRPSHERSTAPAWKRHPQLQAIAHGLFHVMWRCLSPDISCKEV